MGKRLAASLMVLALISLAYGRISRADQSRGPRGGLSAGPVDSAQIALGDRIYHGKVAGGTCAACHGNKGKGSGVAPRLDDAQWLHGDGSLQAIVDIVTKGVTKPVKHDGQMPPKGGANLTEVQVQAVAAYVYSLSHK